MNMLVTGGADFIGSNFVYYQLPMLVKGRIAVSERQVRLGKRTQVNLIEHGIDPVRMGVGLPILQGDLVK